MKRLVIATTLVVALGSIAAGVLFYHSRPPTGWEGRLLDADWSGVYTELMRGGAQKPRPPHLRALLAHACLATNRNNEALRWFLSLRRAEDVAAWTAWTKELGRRHPHEPVALYLQADAAARTGRMPEAREKLAQAIHRHKRFAMAWSARGVVRLLAGDQDGALSDFQRATEIAPDFSDAWSNLGAFWVTRSAAKGALDAYGAAVRIDPYFALGYNGRGCAKVGSGDYQGAAEDFEVAFRLFPELVPAGANQAYALAFVPGGETARLERRPGMHLRKDEFMTKSELENTNYWELKSADKMILYGRSIEQLAKSGDWKGALKILDKQRDALTQRSENLSAEGKQFRSGAHIANNLGKELDIFNHLLSVIPVSPAKGIQPDSAAAKSLRASEWVAKGMRLGAPPGSARDMWTDVMSPVLSPKMASGSGAAVAVTQSAVAIGKHTAYTYGYWGETQARIKELENDAIGNYRTQIDRLRIPVYGVALKDPTYVHERERRQEVERLLAPVTPLPSGDRALLEAVQRRIQTQELPGADVSSKTPGGVTGRPAQISVVEGQWPILTGFGLLYSVPKSPGKDEARP